MLLIDYLTPGQPEDICLVIMEGYTYLQRNPPFRSLADSFHTFLTLSIEMSDEVSAEMGV